MANGAVDDRRVPTEEERAKEHARRRAEYLKKLDESTQELRERVRRSEQLTADDLAVRVNARG